MNDLRNFNDEGLSPAAQAAVAALRAEEDEMPVALRERVWSRLAEAPAVEARGPGRAWRGAAFGLAIAAGLALALIELGRGVQPIAQAPRGEAARYDGAATMGSGAAQRRAGAEAAGLEDGAGAEAAGSEDRSGAAGFEDRSGSRGAAGEAGSGDRSGRAAEAGSGDRSGRGSAGVEAGPGDRSGRTSAGVEAVPEDRPGGGTLAAETALLQRAQTALAAGDPEAALARLGEHARDFKDDGVLGRERDALRVTALCAAGRTAQGRAEAEAFLRAHAGSLLAERVRGACGP